MDKTRKILQAECWISLALLLVLILLFETGVVDEGLWATEDGMLQFTMQSLMTLILFITLPTAFYLFRFQCVKRRLIARKERALLRWGSVRLLMLCVPMVLDAAFYYLFGAVVGFCYMAVIHLLSLTFVFPTKKRCDYDCCPLADEAESENAPLDNQ